MTKALRTMEIKYEQDVVKVRQAARHIAMLLHFDSQDQARIATAVSEIARNALKYARNSRVEFLIGEQQNLEIRVRDEGPGIAQLSEVLDGKFRSETGPGLGITGSQKLMDAFHIDTSPRGTTVTLGKNLPKASVQLSAPELGRICAEIGQNKLDNPFDEIRAQNQELLSAMDELRKQRSELAALNSELEETNRGVVALYSELDDKSRALQLASEVKSRFFSNMSHEFRTPVISVLALCRLLLERSDGELSKEQEKQVTYILKAAENLQEMVNDLLDIAKVESGKLTVRLGEFDIAELFSTLRGMLKPLLPEGSEVSLVFEEAPALPMLYTDAGKLAQIIRNFISNSLKYTERGSVTVSARSVGENAVEFRVADTGIGIAPENHELIFEEFSQVEGALQSKTKGTGLGLPLSRKLAELLGGSVTVESELGNGATFIALIPRVYRETIHPSVEEVKITPREPEKSVLVIDDDEIARYLLGDILKKTSYRLIEATGGKEGVAMARREHPSAIFLDLMMPDMNGFQVLDELKGDPATREIPVIINTSRTVGIEEDPQFAGRVSAVIHKDMCSRAETGQRILEILEKSLSSIEKETSHG